MSTSPVEKRRTERVPVSLEAIWDGVADKDSARVGDISLGGRYIDRFERRNGEWRIALRRVARDWRFDADASQFKLHAGPDGKLQDEEGFPASMRDHTDLSYQRPLQPPKR